MNVSIECMSTYLNEGDPAAVTVKKVPAQWSYQLASVDVVGELGDVLQQDFLQQDDVKSHSAVEHLQQNSVMSFVCVYLERGSVRLGWRGEKLQQQFGSVLFGLNYVKRVDCPLVELETDRMVSMPGQWIQTNQTMTLRTKECEQITSNSDVRWFGNKGLWSVHAPKHLKLTAQVAISSWSCQAKIGFSGWFWQPALRPTPWVQRIHKHEFYGWEHY